MDGQKPNTPEDDFQAASRATAEDDYEDYSNHGAAHSAPKRRLRKFGIALAVLLLLAGVGFGVYWLLKDDGKKDDSSQTTTNTPSTSKTEGESTISDKTEHYASPGFMLEFDHPDNWTVQEETASGVLTATSPAMSLKSPEAKSMTGKVVFTIRNKQQPMPEFDKGNAVASLESEKIDYTKPSSVQRGSTYVSFLRYAGSDALTALDGIFITGDVGYQNGQAIPKADFVPVDPIISVTFLKCADSACAGQVTSTGIDNDQWQVKTFSGPLRKMLQSLVVN